MVKDCAELTGNEFKLIHAFYVSMLALRYRTPLGDRVIWPNQYTWLLQQNLTRWEGQATWGLSVEKIRDQNKSDSVAKFIGLVQVSWFVVQSIMRTAHALPLSQLESMTLSYIPLFTVTYFFWWHKPKDIRKPSIITLPDMTEEQERIFKSMTISDKFDNEGTEEQATYWTIWYLTPRVFEKEAEDKIIRDLEQAVKKATQTATERNAEANHRAIHKDSIFEGKCQHTEYGPIKLPKEIVLSHWDPDLYRPKIWLASCLLGASFGALHLISWDTIFPTTVELWLWRTSAFVSIFSLIVFMLFRKVVLRWGGPLTIISLLSPGLYCISRVIMMGQAFAALRCEDPAIYDTYEVSTYLLHFL
ncbi:hypothetical protein V491_06200 [Pseudogymnoascus sp. VKM F-3775]|nr:hypothetical protein V491_06200 [Pseudogymnoascus sp. VKM F-3775]